MGKVLSFWRPVEEKELTAEEKKKIENDWDAVQQKNKENEERLRKERLVDNSKVLGQYRIRRKRNGT